MLKELVALDDLRERLESYMHHKSLLNVGPEILKGLQELEDIIANCAELRGSGWEHKILTWKQTIEKSLSTVDSVSRFIPSEQQKAYYERNQQVIKEIKYNWLTKAILEIIQTIRQSISPLANEVTTNGFSSYPPRCRY